MYVYSSEFTSGQRPPPLPIAANSSMSGFKCNPDPNSKYGFVFSDDEEVDDNSDDDYQPDRTNVKQRKKEIIATKSKNPVGRPPKNKVLPTSGKKKVIEEKKRNPVGRPPKKEGKKKATTTTKNKNKITSTKTTKTTTKSSPKKALNPRKTTRKKSLLELLESNISHEEEEEDGNEKIIEIEEDKKETTENIDVEDEKLNIIESQKAIIEKLMQENTILLQNQQQQQVSTNSNIYGTDELTPEVISEYDDDYENVDNRLNSSTSTTTTTTTTTTNEQSNEPYYEFDGDYYNWSNIHRNNDLCVKLYNINIVQLAILENFLTPYFPLTKSSISNSVSHSKQLLMILDYILNGTNTTMIASRAALPPQFTHSLIHVFINTHAKLLHNRTKLIHSQNCIEIHFNGQNGEIYYLLVDPRTNQIISHQVYKELVRNTIKWPFEGISISSGSKDFSTDFLDRLSRLCNFMVNPYLLFDHMGARLCYAIWNKLMVRH